MPPPTADPRRPRRRFLAPVLAVLVLAAGAWYVASRGGWVNALRLPPVLDASTPAAQNGFTLLDIQLPGQQQDGSGQKFVGFQRGAVDYMSSYTTEDMDTADAFGLWMDSPSLANNLWKSWRFHNAGPIGDIDSESSVFAKAYSVTAKLSTGDTLPLQWHVRTQQWPRTGKSLFFVSLPTGYSDACRFVDITVTDLSGHAAMWRITRLPRMRHTVPPPSVSTDTVTRDGITMSARAWHSPGWLLPGGQVSTMIGYVLRPILPPNSHQWDLQVTQKEREWEAFGSDGRVKIYGDYFGLPILGRNGVFNQGRERFYGGGIFDTVGTDFYPRMTRFVRLTAELHQFETYDETVTFHNVDIARYDDPFEPGQPNFFISTPQPQTVVTPSGVTISLPPRRTGPHTFSDTESGKISLKLLMSPHEELNDLPASPLVKTFGKAISIHLILTPPLEAGSWSDGPGPERHLSFWPPRPSGKWAAAWPYKTTPQHLATFSIIVRQRVDIQTIPMTFTLAVEDKSPPYYPKGYHLPKRP